MISAIRATLSGWQRARAETDQFMREYADQAGAVTVGVHEGAGVHPGGTNRPPTGETVATVGAKNHFGAPGIPPRPWLDVGLRRAQPKINHYVKRAGGRVPMEQLQHAIGQIAQQEIQQTIVDIDSPPNSPETVALKGSANPLIDTGTLRKSITYEIVSELPAEGIGE